VAPSLEGCHAYLSGSSVRKGAGVGKAAAAGSLVAKYTGRRGVLTVLVPAFTTWVSESPAQASAPDRETEARASAGRRAPGGRALKAKAAHDPARGHHEQRLLVDHPAHPAVNNYPSYVIINRIKPQMI